MKRLGRYIIAKLWAIHYATTGYRPSLSKLYHHAALPKYCELDDCWITTCFILLHKFQMTKIFHAEQNCKVLHERKRLGNFNCARVPNRYILVLILQLFHIARSLQILAYMRINISIYLRSQVISDHRLSQIQLHELFAENPRTENPFTFYFLFNKGCVLEKNIWSLLYVMENAFQIPYLNTFLNF